jgi:hypothetical protein
MKTSVDAAQRATGFRTSRIRPGGAPEASPYVTFIFSWFAAWQSFSGGLPGRRDRGGLGTAFPCPPCWRTQGECVGQGKASRGCVVRLFALPLFLPATACSKLCHTALPLLIPATAAPPGATAQCTSHQYPASSPTQLVRSQLEKMSWGLGIDRIDLVLRVVQRYLHLYITSSARSADCTC